MPSWAAAIGAYVVLDALAGVDGIAPLAVTISWAIAITLGIAMVRDNISVTQKLRTILPGGH